MCFPKQKYFKFNGLNTKYLKSFHIVVSIFTYFKTIHIEQQQISHFK